MTVKTQIRKAVAEAVSALTAEERKYAALHLEAGVGALLEKQPAGFAAVFMPLPDEIDTLPLMAHLAEAGWKVVIPKVNGEDMEFYPYSPAHVSSGAWGILEPETSATPVSADEIDVMIVPGRAFTENGERLGRGKGFYDRYMSRQDFRARTVGVCFKCQVVAGLPSEPHDRKVDEVVAC